MAGIDRDQEDRELKARLEKLSGALGDARQRTENENKAEAASMASGQEAGRAATLAFRMVSELIGGILVGVALGWGLDRLFSTSPFLLIVFSLMGTAAGFWNVVKAASPPAAKGKDAQGG